MSCVLVTAIGSFAANTVINNLHGNNHTVIGTDIYPKEWIAESLNVDRFYQVPKSIEPNYIQFILNICLECTVEYIIPLTDVEVDALSDNRQIFENNNICLCLSSDYSIKLCRDKYRLFKTISNSGLNLDMIPTFEIEEVTDKIGYPMMAKPKNGRSSIGLVKIDSTEDLDFYLNRLDVDDYIFQPLIQGDIVTVDILYDERSNFFVSIPRIELLRTANGAGLSVHVFDNEELSALCFQIANVLQIKGCVNFEFIKDKHNRYYFLECNPRFSGGIAFSCMSGYDFINNHLNCFSNVSIENKFKIKESYYARVYKEVKTK